ncbi:MAG: DUF285 domain-containing protein, partial [Bacilli bacterium]|nr:DUF285 domain-containing protein [Bacilli bacterium]
MRIQYKISLIIISIFLVLSLMLSSSYALWISSISQESTNIVQSDCFEIALTDNNPIGLSASFPLRDSDGVKTTPYTFTIKNICNHPADFQINLETLNTSTIDEEFIKADLNGHIIEYNSAESIETTIDGAKSAIKLYEDTLAINSSKTYNLRTWVNENATQEDVENKSYASKISIIATVRKQFAEGTLIDGPTFSKILKELSGDTDASYISNNESIISVQRSINEPVAADNAVNIAAEGTNTPIYAWFKDGTIYIYSSLDKIYLNPDSSYMFRAMTNLTSLDVSYFDSSNVTNMGRMFSVLNHLTKLDLSNFDTSNVIYMPALFNDDFKLESLSIGNFNTSKVKDFSYMFKNLNKLSSIDLSNFDTSNATNMKCMFYGLNNISKINLTNFNTAKVTDMSGMFYGMSTLTELDISNFDTSKVKNMNNMFNGVKLLENIYLSNFDTSNVTDMSYMFYNMKAIEELDLSEFNTSKVENMSYMFTYSQYIKKIY